MTMATAKEYAREEGITSLSSSFSLTQTHTSKDTYIHPLPLSFHVIQHKNTPSSLDSRPIRLPLFITTHITQPAMLTVVVQLRHRRSVTAAFIWKPSRHTSPSVTPPPLVAYTAATKNFYKASWILYTSIRQRRGDSDDTLDTLFEAIRRDMQFKKKNIYETQRLYKNASFLVLIMHYITLLSIDFFNIVFKLNFRKTFLCTTFTWRCKLT